MGRTLGGDMYMPYAIDVDGHIITMYDPINHESLETEADPTSVIARGAARSAVGAHPPARRDGRRRADARHARPHASIRSSKFYEAPIQLKANGGVFLVDDFGRQRMRPAGSAEPVDRAAREPRRLPHAAHRQEVPGAVRRADRVRDQPRTRRRSPTRRSCAGSRTRLPIEDPTRRSVHAHLRAELPQARPAVPPGDGGLSAAAPLRPDAAADAVVPSARPAGSGDGAVPLSRDRAGHHARAARRRVRGVLRRRRRAGGRVTPRKRRRRGPRWTSTDARGRRCATTRSPICSPRGDRIVLFSLMSVNLLRRLSCAPATSPDCCCSPASRWSSC